MGFTIHSFIDSWSEITLAGVSWWKHGALRFVLIESREYHRSSFAALTDVEEDIIGQKILTRSLNNEFEPEDIAEQYKEFDRSPKLLAQLANRLKTNVDVQLKVPENISVSFDDSFSLFDSLFQFGEEIVLELNAKNRSNQARTMAVALTVCIATSTTQRWIACHDRPIENLSLGASKGRLSSFHREIQQSSVWLDGHLQLKIPSEFYLRYGKQENLTVRYYIHAQIKETDQTFTRDANIVFNRDDILKPVRSLFFCFCFHSPAVVDTRWRCGADW